MASALETYHTQSFSSFSGSDIKVSFAGEDVGSIQAISYAIQREKAPIYVMGDPNPKAFSRGKRGIAGTCIFVVFDSHSLMGYIDKTYKNYVSDKGELNPSVFEGPGNVDLTTGGENALWSDYELKQANYVDQIPPVDIIVSAVNEVGGAAVLRIWAAEFLNEGWGISTDDQVSEMQTTYVCRGITKWTRAGEGGVTALPFEKPKTTSPGTAISNA